MNSSIKDMNLTEWEKIFVINYYDVKEHTLPKGKEKYTRIKKDISESLNNLYALANNKDAFLLDPNSPEVLRNYENELSILEGQGKDTSYLIANKEAILKDISDKLSIQLYEEYCHIISNIRLCPYEDAFKVLMLYETLTRIYRFEINKGKRSTFVSKRKMCESIKSHMILNGTTLEIIYNNIGNYSKFSEIYFDALDEYNKKIVSNATISLDDTNSYEKGMWIRFEARSNNPDEYTENVQKLASLVKNTQWCTKYLSSTMLSEGDIYVFVDNDNNPHLAVKLIGNEIDEVRGIANGANQEIEEEYRDVILSFLEHNKNIKYGLEWLEKEEWNRRLIKYNKLITKKCFSYDMMELLISDLFDFSYCKYESTQRTELLSNLHLIAPFIAKYFNCSIEKICLGDAIFEDTDYETCPYKIILGDAIFSLSKIQDTDNLLVVCGNVETYESSLDRLNKIEIILGNADLSYSSISDLGELRVIGGDLDINECGINTLSKLCSIGGNAYLSSSILSDLGDLGIILKDAYISSPNLENTGKLRTIIGNAIISDNIDISSINEVLGKLVYGNKNYSSIAELREDPKVLCK